MVSRSGLLFRVEGEWYRVGDGSRISSPWLRRKLDLLDDPQRSFVQLGPITLLPVPSGRPAVLAVETSGSASDRRVVEADLRTCIRVSIPTYQARYDALTDLLLRRPLQNHLRSLVRIGSAVSADNMRPVAMLFDLDNFKQANDTVSHNFGDALLTVAARRLEACAENWKERGVARKLRVGRWGGEEFVVFGLFDPEKVAALADELQSQWQKGEDRPQPLSGEERQFLQQIDAAKYPSHELTAKLTKEVTISLGWTWIRGADTEPELTQMVQRAVAEADAAMYRAKQIGKARAVAFDEIRHKHGRVLHHRQDAGIVAIDIGASVGVRNGDVFEVAAPGFADSGVVATNDGRTTRVLGYHPAVRAAAELVVCAEPQQDIAFCEVVRFVIGASQISPQSHLRWIGTRAQSTATPTTPRVTI